MIRTAGDRMNMYRGKSAAIALALCLLWSCNSTTAERAVPPNFLVLIGDDMGVETLSCYGVGSAPAITPHLDQLCDAGMRFDNFWSQPVCSPTRATILTGQYGFRSGVGTPVQSPDIDYPVPELPATAAAELAGRAGAEQLRRNGRQGNRGRRNNRQIEANPNAQREGYTEPPNERPGLPGDAFGLPTALSSDQELGYQTAAVGKWHLATADNGVLENVKLMGFDHYAGNYSGGGVESFFAWSKVIDGEITDGETGYATSATVDDALAWLDNRNDEKPWLLWVAFNAPHSPYGEPPASLLSRETAENLQGLDVASETRPFYAAMIEAMDTEIGRLLESIDADELSNTYVIFLGDNGTPGRNATLPFSRQRVKGTVYQGGVNVPFMVAGPGVESGTISKSLANSVDLFATILDLAGVSTDGQTENPGPDSMSLAPVLDDPATEVREFAYADVFGPQQNRIVNSRAIRNDRYKLVVDLQNDTKEFYDLASDPYESTDLMSGELGGDAAENLDELTRQLNELISSR